MPDVYIAPPPPMPRYKHTCDYPGTYDPERPVGSIWKCTGCGRYWYKYSMRGIEWHGGLGRNWEKVHWWNRKYRKKIKELERNGN